MSGVTGVGGWAPQALVRCATCCCVPHGTTPTLVGHTLLRHFHFLRGGPGNDLTVHANSNAISCTRTRTVATSVCPFHSAALVSGSSPLQPCHRALRLLHQRRHNLNFVYPHGTIAVVELSTLAASLKKATSASSVFVGCLVVASSSSEGSSNLWLCSLDGGFFYKLLVQYASSIHVKGFRFASHWKFAVSCKSTSSMEQHYVNTRITTPCPDVVIGNPVQLEKKKKAIRAAGLSTLQVIADFDMTLTKYLVDGVRGQSTHALLKSNPAYDLKRHQLFEHYYPLEISPDLPTDEKAIYMDEWWGKSHALLLEGGLNYESIVSSVANATISFRDGITQFFETLDEEGVPVLIFSAGLADIIEEVLRQKLHRVFSNIRVVSNRMEFDDDGDLTGFKGKTIHVLNKNEHALEMATPLHDDHGNLVGDTSGASIVQGRSNVLLLGDHLGDLGMSDGVEYENRISVGFLNENAGNWLETYKEAFDIVVLNDGSLKPVVELIKELGYTNVKSSG